MKEKDGMEGQDGLVGKEDWRRAETGEFQQLADQLPRGELRIQ